MQIFFIIKNKLLANFKHKYFAFEDSVTYEKNWKVEKVKPPSTESSIRPKECPRVIRLDTSCASALVDSPVRLNPT